MTNIPRQKRIERRPFPIEGEDRESLRLAGALVVDSAIDNGNVWLTYKGRGLLPTGGIVRELIGGMKQRWHEIAEDPDSRPFIITPRQVAERSFPMTLAEYLAQESQKKLLIVNDANLFTNPGQNTVPLLHTLSNVADEGTTDIVTLSPYSIRFIGKQEIVQPGTQEYFKHTVNTALRVVIGDPGLVELGQTGIVIDSSDPSTTACDHVLKNYQPQARR
jgi:hypothetical protein